MKFNILKFIFILFNIMVNSICELTSTTPAHITGVVSEERLKHSAFKALKNVKSGNTYKFTSNN